MFKKLEMLANICIVVVSILVAVGLVRTYLVGGFSRAATHEGRERLQSGSRISLPDVDWAANGQTVLLALSKGCHFCSESAPFYRQVAADVAGAADVRLIALLPQEVSEGRKYLEDLGLSIQDVRQSSLDSIGVQGTPTLVLVDKTGVVTDTWIGKLPPDKEQEVLTRLKCKSCE